MKKYSALIIDLKKSRSYSIEDRNSIQNYIKTVIEKLNLVFSESLSKSVDFSAGDEIQGLFNSSESAFLYFRIFYMLIFPVEIRAGIGFGEWNVKVEKASTTAQDGPVYHNARKAIENIKDTVGYCILFYSGTKIDLFLNGLMNTSFSLINKNTEYQNELLLLFELLHPINYKKVIKPCKIKLICNLIMSKSSFKYYMYHKKNQTVKNYPLNTIEFMTINSIPIDIIDEEVNFYVSSGKKRGMTILLSELLNISRQSIDKTIKTANIYEARNSDIIALKFMDKYL